MKKLTIWQMNGSMNAGGTESLIMELLRNCPYDVQTALIVHGPEDQPAGTYDEEIRELGVPIYHLPSVGSVGYRRYKAALAELIERIGKPDVIHSHMNAVGGFVAKAAKECGVGVRIVHCHADIKYRGSALSVLKSEVGLFLMKIFVNRYATHYWACSQAAAKRLFYGGKKTTVIPNVIDVQKYLSDDTRRASERAALGIPNERLVIGSVGRIARIKNYEVIIKAVAALARQNVPAHFYCYGRPVSDAYFAELNELVAKLKIGDCVHFLGNSDRIHEALAAFDVFAMPSITEGLGIAALEAQAAGLPTVLSTGVPQEADMGLGLITRAAPGDVEGWQHALANAARIELTHSQIQAAFSAKGYDSKTKCDEIYKNYREAVTK